jgi:hypothetical protein
VLSSGADITDVPDAVVSVEIVVRVFRAAHRGITSGDVVVVSVKSFDRNSFGSKSQTCEPGNLKAGKSP